MEDYGFSGFFLLAGMPEALKVALGCCFGFLKCVFLAPMNNGCRTYLLYDPVKDLGIVTNIQQDICHEISKHQPGIFGLRSLLCCYNQLELPHAHGLALCG
jgi:hypothetical protein